MNCKKIQKLLSGYIDNEIDNNSAVEIEKHLSICADCRKDYETLLKTKKLLSSLPSVDLPSDFYGNIYQKISERTKSISTIRLFLDWIILRKKQALAFSLVFVILFGYFLIKTLHIYQEKNISLSELFLEHLSSDRRESAHLNRNGMTFVISHELILASNHEIENEIEE